MRTLLNPAIDGTVNFLTAVAALFAESNLIDKFGASGYVLAGMGEGMWSITPLRSSAVPELASASASAYRLPILLAPL